MKQEDYVSFETAKILEEKGYLRSCNATYFRSGVFVFGSEYQVSEIKAPTLWDAQKWLREEQALSIEPKNAGFEDEWECYIMNIITGRISQCGEHIPSYEEALDAGIREALKLI